MSNNPMKKTRRKHISQLNPTGRARADQAMQFALLAIVESQTSKSISIPYDHAEQVFDENRLKITIRDGHIVLESEKMKPTIIASESRLLQ